MPIFLTRLRSARRSKSTSTPAIDTIETDSARHDRRVTQDEFLDSPSQNVDLDSKIHPDLSALFTSVEDALKTVGRVAAAQKQTHTYDDTGADWTDGEEGAEGKLSERKSMDDKTMYRPFGSRRGPGWTTFGRDEDASLKALERAHITDRNGAISANLQPSSTDAMLSWSPKAIESSDSLRPSDSSDSSPPLYPSPEVQQSTQQGVSYSPSPRTFGHPSPSQFTPTGSPAFPLPAFHSTPKMSASPLQSMHKPSPSTSSRFRLAGLGLPPLSSTFGRMKRTKSEQPRSSKNLTSGPVYEAGKRQQVPSRPSIDVRRGPSRRKSAEWNARVAAAGVIADPKQTTEFGWPAEVSREILRLSLGEQAMAHIQDAPPTADPEKAVAKSRDQANSKRGGPRVSHELKDNARLMRSSISEQRSSVHLYSSTPLPSSSSAPGRSDRFHSFATQLTSTPRVPTVAPRRTVKSRLQSSSDNALDTKSDVKGSAAGVAEHRRSLSESKVEWESRELQDFLSREVGSGDLAVDVLRPGTPMKQSTSESTYETAGSSSFLHAPSLSVIAPTPRGSPGRSRNDSGADLEVEDGLQIPTPPPQSDKSKGKRKAEESEEGSPPDLRGSKSKKATFATDGKRSQRNSNASHAPSSFQSFQSQKSRKRVRLSSPMATPDQSRSGSAIPPHPGSVSSRGSGFRAVVTTSHFQHTDSKTAPPRAQSRASRTSRNSRAMSTGASGASSGGGSVPFPKRRSLSQSSIPISAIVSPRAPSLDRLSSFHMRDPQKPPPRHDVGWSLRFSSHDEKGSPFMAWAFWFGFLFPPLWWLASFWRIPKTRMVGTDTEKAVIVDDPYFEREGRAWRLRCRVASILFFVTYAPVIILLAIFVPRP